MSDEPLRPDPDRLLQHTAAASRQTKVFFGACAGVGKPGRCWRKRSGCAQGLDILIGVAETHGRKETARCWRAEHPAAAAARHRGRYVYEFDLDAALARRPALILVDELAHSNAPGSAIKALAGCGRTAGAGLTSLPPLTSSIWKA
jgi:two-component system sensor histidine kinase KdpD